MFFEVKNSGQIEGVEKLEWNFEIETSKAGNFESQPETSTDPTLCQYLERSHPNLLSQSVPSNPLLNLEKESSLMESTRIWSNEAPTWQPSLFNLRHGDIHHSRT
jgi:hypothetical protein